MANKVKHYNRQKTLTLSRQRLILLKTYPESSCRINKHKTLIWKASIKPSLISISYKVELFMKPREHPKVWVVGDELEKLDDPNFPHNYKIDLKKKKVLLCLYRYEEFSAIKSIAHTIIPWTIEWLYFYEIWLAIGTWCGGGEHPKAKNKKTGSQYARNN